MDHIYLDWSDFKNQILFIKKIRYIDRNDFYKIYYKDDGGTFETTIMKDSGDDHLDFENNYKDLCNQRVDQLDVNGRKIMRPTYAQNGWSAQFHSLRITTSSSNGIYSKNKDGSDIGFTTYTMKDSNGDVTNNPALCVETIVTWEPTFNIEIIAGSLLQKSIPVNDVILWVTGAPDIGEEYGGNVKFTNGGIFLNDIGIESNVNFDGRTSKFIQYDPVYHSGKFEILLKHSQGYSHTFSLIFQFFKQ